MRPHATFGFILAIAALSTNVSAGQEKTAEKNEAVTKLLKTQLQSAKKAQLAAIDQMQVKSVGGVLVFPNSNHPRPEEAYTWSVRWLNAQRDLGETKEERITAFVDHHSRMKELRVVTTVLVGDGKDGFLTPAEAAVAVPAVEWYLAQAEEWLMKERGK